MTFERDYFEQQYRDYERQNPARKLVFYRYLLVRSVPRGASPRVLDYGCAFGLLLGELDRRWQRTGIDASSWAVQRARNRFPDIDFRCLEPGSYPEIDRQDVIAAFDVLEHVPSLDECLRWLWDSLAVGGALVFVVPVYDGPSGPFIRWLDRDPTHVHRESRAFWLQRVGQWFEIEDWWGILRYLVPGGPYLHLVTHRLRHWTPAMACVARRREPAHEAR